MKTLIAWTMLIAVISGCTEKIQNEAIPVIYCTDLYHPPMDPDDHFDLACMFSIREFDIRAIIIDNATKVPVTPGIIPVRQMEKITGRSVRVAVGLKNSLKSVDDDGSAQRDCLQGVQLILRTLEQSERPVTLITVGSVRDVAAAINSDPDLCRKKIGRIFVFAGDATVTDPSIFREYNVELDTLAFARVMNSGLDIYWVPCFDGGGGKNNGRASYIIAPREKLFSAVSPRLMNYFRFCLLAKKDSLYLDALDQPANQDEINTITYKQEEGHRNLWCSHVFPYIARRTYLLDNNECLTCKEGSKVKNNQVIVPFTFTDEYTITDLRGMVWTDTTGKKDHRIHLFKIVDKETFTRQMTSVVSHLLEELTI